MDINNLKIAYIGGGSMNFGWKFISELVGEEEIAGTVYLFDTDKQLSLANEVIGNKLRESIGKKSRFIFLAVDKIEEALRSADFVIISISQGTLEELVSDIHLPEMYGIYQSVGDSTGPGGIVRAVRTMPVFVKIAQNIQQYCPNAWVMNLTNPMGVCLRVLKEVFPEIKVFGSSNEPFSTQELLAEMVSTDKGISSIFRRDIRINLMGIPGFSWVNEAHYNGENIMPIFAKFAEDYCVTGYEKKLNDYKNTPLGSANMVKFDLFMRYGIIPANADCRIAEFCPPWYLKNPKVVSSWKFNLTSVNYQKKKKIESALRQKRLVSGEELLKPGFSGTECILQLKALLGLKNIITNVELLNNGQINNIPKGTIVESNALFSNNSIKPVVCGDLPDEVLALTLRQVYNQSTLVKAVMEKDLDIAFNAFLNDPLMTIDVASATELYREMLAGIRTHLIYYC